MSAEAEAKARLIAAAPALLNAAELCLYFMVENFPEHDSPEEPCDGESLCRECEEGGCVEMRINACRAAIAAATGSQA